MKKIIIATLGVILLSSFRRKKGSMNPNKGKTDAVENRGNTSYAVFNRNPLNIKVSKTHRYGGEISAQGAIHRMFETWEDGTAAAFQHLRRYILGEITGDAYPKGTRLNTIEKIIATWAPKTDPRNDTQGYINYVEKKSGISRYKILSFNQLEMTTLLASMAPMEDGQAAKFLTPSVLKAAWGKKTER